MLLYLKKKTYHHQQKIFFKNSSVPGIYWYKSFLFLSFLLLINTVQNIHAIEFKQEKMEFPNYFRELLSDASSNSVKKEKSKGSSSHREAQGLIENAMKSILAKLRLPYIKKIQGRNIVEHVGFFSELNSLIKEFDPEAKIDIAISGGVVRSVLGYLYEQVYKRKQKNPKLKTSQILKEIIEKEDLLPPIKVLGIGSDLDLLVKFPKDYPKVSRQDLKRKLVTFINETESYLGLRNSKFKLKYSIVPIADVKDYDEQIERTTNQGGATTDWLSFSTLHNQIILPEEYPDIFKKFLEGNYSYLPAKSPKYIQDASKQLVRGLRILTEIPFISPDDESKANIKKEIDDLLEKIQGGKNPMTKNALDQFAKLLRNTRLHSINRFYDKGNDLFEKIIELSEKIMARNYSKDIPIPKLARYDTGLDSEDRKTKIDHLLEPPLEENNALKIGKNEKGEFIIYHGTPTIDSLLSIIRAGMKLSIPKVQGRALYGPGVYTSPHENVSKSYGNVLKLILKDPEKTRILDWDSKKNSEEMKNIIQEAEDLNIHPFELLSKKYKVDIIKHNHLLVQNEAVIKIDNSIDYFLKLLEVKSSEHYRNKISLRHKYNKDWQRKDKPYLYAGIYRWYLMDAIQPVYEVFTLLKNLGLDKANDDSTFYKYLNLPSEIPKKILESVFFIEKSGFNNAYIKHQAKKIIQIISSTMSPEESTKVLDGIYNEFVATFEKEFANSEENPSDNLLSSAKTVSLFLKKLSISGKSLPENLRDKIRKQFIDPLATSLSENKGIENSTLAAFNLITNIHHMFPIDNLLKPLKESLREKNVSEMTLDDQMKVMLIKSIHLLYPNDFEKFSDYLIHSSNIKYYHNDLSLIPDYLNRNFDKLDEEKKQIIRGLIITSLPDEEKFDEYQKNLGLSLEKYQNKIELHKKILEKLHKKDSDDSGYNQEKYLYLTRHFDKLSIDEAIEILSYFKEKYLSEEYRTNTRGDQLLYIITYVLPIIGNSGTTFDKEKKRLKELIQEITVSRYQDYHDNWNHVIGRGYYLRDQRMDLRIAEIKRKIGNFPITIRSKSKVRDRCRQKYHHYQ